MQHVMRLADSKVMCPQPHLLVHNQALHLTETLQQGIKHSLSPLSRWQMLSGNFLSAVHADSVKTDSCSFQDQRGLMYWLATKWLVGLYRGRCQISSSVLISAPRKLGFQQWQTSLDERKPMLLSQCTAFIPNTVAWSAFCQYWISIQGLNSAG